MGRVRPAAVAGRFYPADPEELAGAVEELVGVARETAAVAAPPKALIAPHAGYAYSGPVAASAYAPLGAGRDSVRRVVLLGPAHYAFVRGLAVPSADAFATPLGDVPVDRAGTAALAALPGVTVDDRAHAPEHCLEVQLPFLQRVLAGFAIVPALVGDADAEDVATALDAVWGDAETAVVVSSDLSHYHDAPTARRLDASTADAIERSAFEDLDDDAACGSRAIAGLLLAARRRDLVPHRLDLRNSGDIAGGGGPVVGYGAWAFAPRRRA